MVSPVLSLGYNLCKTFFIVDYLLTIGIFDKIRSENGNELMAKVGAVWIFSTFNIWDIGSICMGLYTLWPRLCHH
jgi:hypothetical protein